MKNTCRYFAFALLGLCFYTASLTAQVTDTQPPKMTCWQQRYVNCHPSTCQGKIQAIEFIVWVTDDQTPTNEITLGIRKKCTGNGFPDGKTSLTFSVAELGLADVELWAKDLAGNTAVCPAQAIVTDNSGTCDPSLIMYTHTPKDSTNIKGTVATIDLSTCNNEVTISKTDLPFQSFGSLSRPGDLLVVTPSKTGNPLNGVTTYDLVLISKHILGLDTLSPYQLIAADANQDGKVTTYDIVLLRQLILGIITELPNQTSWRFVPYDYEFPDPANPFSPMFPERIESPRSADPVINFFPFFGIKIGDVDYSADLK